MGQRLSVKKNSLAARLSEKQMKNLHKGVLGVHHLVDGVVGAKGRLEVVDELKCVIE